MKEVIKYGTLYKHIPIIKRARGYRLYDKYGNRIIDLYQNNGHALLGHRAHHITNLLKNVLSKGLIFDLPSLYELRLEKAVKNIIPGFKTVMIFRSAHEGLDALSEIMDKKVSLKNIFDPITENKTGEIPLWRPYLEYDYSKYEVIVPILPFSVAGAPFVICFKETVNATLKTKQPVAPFLLAGAARTIWDLIKYKRPQWLNNRLLEGCKKWEQNGIYVKACMTEEEYESAFLKFLENHFLLPPQFPGSCIIPFELSPGELEKLIQLFKKIPGA